MFTGIVEERGEVVAHRGHSLVVACGVVGADSPVGASVAVSGVCLTVVANEPGSLSFELSDETLARTTLGRVAAGDPVNLERPVSLAARLGGHLVQGHVDGVGRVVTLRRSNDGDATLRLEVPPGLLRYCVEKGSIALDGVSLTVASLDECQIEVALIPHTLAATTFGAAEAGHAVNLEVDLMAKYVERLLERSAR